MVDGRNVSFFNNIPFFCLEEPGELLAPGLVVDAEENSGGSRGGSLLSYNQIPLSFC